MDFRAKNDEKITGESWLIRDKFLTVTDRHAAKKSLATNPKKLGVPGIKQILNRALWAQNIRQPLENNERRHEFKSAHGYRKYFKSNAERVMRPLNVELLMDHKTGVSDSYWRPTEQDLLEDYLKAVDYLTVNKDQKIATQLQKQVAELTEKSEEQNYFIRDKLAKKEKEIEEIKAQMTILQANSSNLLKVVMGFTNDLKLYSWNRDDGPTDTAKMIEQEQEQQKNHPG